MRIYDNRIRDGLQRLRSYAPGYYKDIAEATAIWTGDGYNLDRLMTAFERAVDGNLVHLAGEQELKMYEVFLKIPYDSTQSIKDRRTAISIHYIGNGHIGASEIKTIVNRFTPGEVDVKFQYSGHWVLNGKELLDGSKNLNKEFQSGVIIVTVTRDYEDTFQLSYVTAILKERLPAHLMLIVVDNMIPIKAENKQQAIFAKLGMKSGVYEYTEYWTLDGGAYLDGSKDLNSLRGAEFTKAGIICSAAEISTVKGYLRMDNNWTLNGSELLDGSRMLAIDKTTEV